MPTILVTGATGKVGAQLVSILVTGGAAVRAAVRAPDRAGELAALGAELARFDYDDPASARAALVGVDRLFIIAPPTLAPATMSDLLDAAGAAGVRFIGKLSTMGASPDSPIQLGRAHAATDELIRSSGADFALLRPTVFMDNLVAFAAGSIRDRGAFFGASGDGRVSWVSSRDLAEVAAAVLLEPAAHRGQTYRLTGPEPLSCPDVAAILSEIVGRPIRYVDLPPDQLRASLIERGIPAPFADGLVTLEAVKASGELAAVSPAVEQVLGRPGERYRDFLRRHRDRLI